MRTGALKKSFFIIFPARFIPPEALLGRKQRRANTDTLETGPRVRKRRLNVHLFFPQIQG